MKEKSVIEVSNLGKRFSRSTKHSAVLAAKDLYREFLGKDRQTVLRPTEFWALRDINFELKEGEALGLIGVNGSGKTTLIKLLSGLLKPDEGRISVKGRVAPLIALGAGFTPILSGRENIYINLGILGISQKDIDKRIQEIIDFSELHDTIDSPVRTYSSGMEARLGFACAVMADPEVLLVDEILAVGDLKFRNKCFRKLANMRKNGLSLVYVSHSSSSVLSVCDRALYLNRGQVIMDGKPGEVTKKYEKDLFGERLQDSVSVAPDNTKRHLEEDAEVTFTSFKIDGKSLEERPQLTTTKKARLDFKIQVHKPVNYFITSVSAQELSRQDEWTFRIEHDTRKEFKQSKIKPGTIEISIDLDPVVVKPGGYRFKISLRNEKLYMYDAIDNIVIEVIGDPKQIHFTCHQPYRSRSTLAAASSSRDVKTNAP